MINSFICLHDPFFTEKPATPTDLQEVHTCFDTADSIHIFQWSINDTKGLKEFQLMENGSYLSSILPEQRTFHYVKEIKESVTLALTAKNQCGNESDISSPLNLKCKFSQTILCEDHTHLLHRGLNISTLL